jgi:regulator of ribonuclease activity A
MFTTADLWDEHDTLLSCVDSILIILVTKSFSGKITTIKLFEDNLSSKAVRTLDGKGKVLLIDGALRCALGDQLAELAIQNNWQGIIVNGCIRDSEVLTQ